VYVQFNVETRSCNNCCSGKAISITYSECVSVALGIQHTMRMRLITLSSVACCAYSIFPHYLVKKGHAGAHLVEALRY
jgi:hypothetical protein